MRYLWVEDFNDEGNSSTGEELEIRLKEFFDLNDDKVIVRKTLSSAIDFLENDESLEEIDAILIDIRFPEENIKDLYSLYFQDIMTLEFYSTNMEYASGIMLYLLLVFRYNISHKKMAFISANISSNANLKKLNDMIEIILKYKFADVTDKDIARYNTLEINLGKDILKISSAEKEWQTFIVDNKIDENVDLDELLGKIRALSSKDQFKDEYKNNDENSDISGVKAKYNDVKEQFNKIGFAMPEAFEKPAQTEKIDKRYLFTAWEANVYSSDYNAIRSNIQEMCNILIKYLRSNEFSNEIYSNFCGLFINKDDENEFYEKQFFVEYLKGVKRVFPINRIESEKACCDRALREIATIWESSCKPKCKSDFYVCHAVMKLTRNWTSHQGITNVELRDVGLLFLLSMRGIFDIEILSEKYKEEYDKYEKKILLMYEICHDIDDKIKESFEYFSNLNIETIPEEIRKNNKNPSMYDFISGIGNSKNKAGREVYIDELYMLIYHILYKGCNGIYVEIKERIKYRTWYEWQERYDKRFREFLETKTEKE